MNGYGGNGTTTYGVPTSTWLSWNAHTQQLWLQDYTRTQPQADYYKEKGTLYDVAYTYTGLVDVATGLDASEIGANVNATIEDVKEKAGDVLSTGKDIGIILAIGAAVLFLSK